MSHGSSQKRKQSQTSIQNETKDGQGGFKKFNPNEMDPSDRSIHRRMLKKASMGSSEQIDDSDNAFKRKAKRMKSVKMIDVEEDSFFDDISLE
jgi:hypothetical protein